jgi:hypothetical protein
MKFDSGNSHASGDSPDPCDVAPLCPICNGKMEVVYYRPHQKVCVCVDCQSGLTVPAAAIEVARLKRDTQR